MMRCVLLSLVIGVVLGGCSTGEPDGRRMNGLQVIGSHNSYKMAIDPALLSVMKRMNPQAAGWDYDHPALDVQLDLGLRALELDVFDDPAGGLFATPLGLTIPAMSGQEAAPFDPDGVMRLPGFKVLHVQDLDFRSHDLTLARALERLRGWSDRNPGHLPIVVTMNCKDEALDRLPGAAVPVPFDGAAFDRLDRAVLAGLGREKLLMPDDVRGDASSLEAAVLARGWPALSEARGRFVFVLDAGEPKRGVYLRGRPSLGGRVFFVTSGPGVPSAAFMVINDPVREGARIRELVSRGYLVRTRADAATREARENDRSRFEAAMGSGAQVISTDYYVPDVRLSPYHVDFGEAGFVRENPVWVPHAEAGPE